jgi:hypothetical protein
MTDDDNLFARWSRRKRRVAEEEAAEPQAEPVAVPVEEIAEPETPEAEAELLRQLELPVPESLKEGDDFSAFMRTGVPEFLRKRALRVLWRSNPVLANLDGLNDYDDDFRSPELTRKVIATAYKIGHGFPRNEPKAEILQNNDNDAGNEEVIPAELPPEFEVPETPLPQTVTNEATVSDNGGDDDDLSFKPKRMRFQT